MSEESKPSHDTISDPGEAGATQARKTAKKVAKKAAKKAAKIPAKKAAKKVALEDVERAGNGAEAPAPARKAAKKAVRKTAKARGSDEAQGEMSFGTPAAAEVRVEAPVRDEARAERPAEVREDRGERPRRDAEGGEGSRFGRVPGGGPVARDGGGNRELRSTREGETGGAGEVRQHRENHEHREPREPREHREPRDHGETRDPGPRPVGEGQGDARERKKRRRKRRRDRRGREREGGDREGGEAGGGAVVENSQEAEPRPHVPVFQGPKVEVSGLLELAPKGFGFLRLQEKRFEQARDDVFVSPEMIRNHGLRLGQWVTGLSQEGSRGPQLVEVTDVNGMDPALAKKLPAFEELKAVNPSKRISFETEPNRFTTRVVDLMSPVGRGQRGLIVSPPRSGKTTLLLHMAEAVRELHDETLHLMVLLVDERPEEVTEFRRCLPGAEIYASSNDEHPRNHARLAELCIERAKRLVEAGRHVFLLMDSITRLARAYNNGMGGGRGRGIGSGGIMVGALETPRRLFAAARNTREAGSLTILATALVQTNSRADEAIFQEFKGTGNMELVLDRKIAENYLYPAVDIFKSGTRREELLLPSHTLHKIHMIRRGLSGHRPVEAMERLLFFLKKFPNNPQMLLEIKG